MSIGRLGHSAFYDNEANAIFVFGGQQEGIGGPKAAREFQNDLWKLCLKSGKYDRIYISNLAGVSRRIYCTGFILSKYIFLVGGLDVDGKCLREILMIDTEGKFCRTVTTQNNKTLQVLQPLCSSACVPAFYASRYDSEGINLCVDRVR